MQTVRPSIPITLWNLKWIGQGALKLERDMWNERTDSRTLVYHNTSRLKDGRLKMILQLRVKRRYRYEGRTSGFVFFFNCVIFNIQNMFVKMPYNVLQIKYCKLTFITIEKMFHKWNDLNSILKIKCDFITFYKWNGSGRCFHKLYITRISQH